MKTKKLKTVLTILLFPIALLATECTTFTDIDSSSYKSDILAGSDEGWITCNDTFDPYRETFRIEAVKMVIVASGVNPPATTEQCFDDVPTDDWMNPYACYGKKSGLLVDRANFLPTDSINFAEASKLILRSVTNQSYSESGELWYEEYLQKMALYGFDLAPEATINRDYFTHILRTVQADPNKQPVVVEEPKEEEPTTENNDTTVEEPIVEDNETIESNTTTESNSSNEDIPTEVVNEVAQGGFEYWFEPYRCFDTTAPALELKVENDTADSNGNRNLDIEYYTDGGTQSCVDSWGETRQLRFGTRWSAEGIEFGDLTTAEDKSKYKYKKVRVTIPSGKATEVKLAVITTLGKVMVQSLFIDSDGEITFSDTVVYGLNDIKITNENILAKIKELIVKLERIKIRIAQLKEFSSRYRSNDALKNEFDAIKKELDDAKKAVDAIKQAIDQNIEDNDEKDALKKEADKIKKEIDDIKKLIDGYKQEENNSQEAIDTMNSEIDNIIAMMRSGEKSEEEIPTYSYSVPKGTSAISGTIDTTTLPKSIYALFIVDNAKWYGYSPHADVQEEIKSTYQVIDGVVEAHKGSLIFAYEDTTIEMREQTSDMDHEYNKGLSLHGTNGVGLSATDIECKKPNQLTAVIKVRGSEPSIYLPDSDSEELENFTTIDANDGYYVLCDKPFYKKKLKSKGKR